MVGCSGDKDNDDDDHEYASNDYFLRLSHTTFIHQKPVIKRQWINYNTWELNLTELWILTQYISNNSAQFFAQLE